MLHFIEVLLRDLVQEDAKSADLGRELIVRLLLGAKERARVHLELALLVG